MSISDALNYPFRNNNMLKILPIALAYGIILFLTEYSTIENNIALMCGSGIAAIVFGIFIGGYYVSALRRLQAGDENLPEVDFGQNLKDGFLTGLAGLLYMLPVIILIIVAVVIGTSSNGASSDGGGGLLICGAILVAIGLGLVLSAAMEVAIVRYTAEDSTSALFDWSRNWGLATSNFGTVLGLWGRIFVIVLIGGVISFALGAILGVMFPGQINGYAEPTLFYWLISALVNVASYTISIFIALGQYHLMYRFGQQLGIGTNEKSKNEPYSF